MRASLIAGVSSAVAGLLAFLVVHHFWIRPIWFIAPVGLLIATVGGLAIGGSFLHLRDGLPRGGWTIPAVFGVMIGMVAPGILLSFTHGPLFDLATARILPGRGPNVVLHLALELVLPALVVGALAGYAIRRTVRAAAATSLAGLAFALGPGHNIPMFGTDPHAWKGHAIVFVIAIVTASTLVSVERWTRRPQK